MGPLLPGIFRREVDAWTFYQLATLVRLNYTFSDAPLWARVRQAWRTHWSRLSTTSHDGTTYPQAQLLFFPDYQVVVIAGTTSLEEYVTSLQSVTLTPVAGAAGAAVGSGWAAMAQAQWNGLVALGLDPAKPVIFTGHSLGGVLAIMHAYRVKQAVPSANVATVTFGCPRVGTAAFNGLLPGTHWRVVHAWDVASSYPASGWEASGGTLTYGAAYRPYAHSGNMVWLDALQTRMVQGSGNDYSGIGYHARLHGDPTPNSFWNSVGYAAFQVLRLEMHKIFAYVQYLRRLVRDVETFQLTGFDLVNQGLNTLWDEDWADPEILLDGFRMKGTRLPTDPPLPLPAAPPEVGPLNDVAPVPVLPGGMFLPLTPLQQQQLQNRRRRNIG